jgi:hypothetical protein
MPLSGDTNALGLRAPEVPSTHRSATLASTPDKMRRNTHVRCESETRPTATRRAADALEGCISTGTTAPGNPGGGVFESLLSGRSKKNNLRRRARRVSVLTVPTPVPVLAQAQEALKTVRHVPLEEATDRNDAVFWFLFLRDILKAS